mmetsp:Transcript_107149/g.313337  ORF Transcript_107149/g.313337 Transcript_107149/m.313337 type:complete len:298 (+) Transcript_107149:102-995(+)
MAPPRSVSLKKLSAMLFQESDAFRLSEAEEEGFEACRFERTLSEDSTVPGQPFSRYTSTVGSDGEPEPPSPRARQRLVALPEAAGLLKGQLSDPGPEVSRGQELIAVRPDGEACFVPEDQLAEIEVMRAQLANDEISSLVLVARDGTSYFVPDGSRVEWDKLEELHACARAGAASPFAAPAAGRPDGTVRAPPQCCSKARARRPLEAEVFDQEAFERSSCVLRKPEGSVPRSPSLKKLSKLLFAASDEAAGRTTADADPEELELEAPWKAAKAASPSLPHGPRLPLAWWAASGCWQQ